jgi:glycosyltransferase involved in cell wall biosynthesis
VNSSIGATLEKLFKSIDLCSDLESEVILIDDGSLVPLEESIPLEMREHIQIFRNETNRGIGDALLIGCQKAKYNSVLFLPGHDFYSSDAIKLALQLVGKAPVVIGYRTNMWERPPIKRFASLVFRNLLKMRTNRFILDPHGLPIYPKQKVLDSLPVGSRHALHIYVLRSISREKLGIIQFPAAINSEYEETLLSGPASYLTYGRNIMSVLKIILKPN